MNTATLAGTEKPESLKDKVGAAFDKLEGGDETTDEKVVDKKVATKEDTDDDEDESNDDDQGDDDSSDDSATGDDLSEAEIAEAQKLYKALKNPGSAKAVAAALAEQYGVRYGAPETKTEVKEAKQDILAKVTEALGPEYAFLAPKFGKAVEAALDVVREEQSTQISELQMTNLINETDNVLKTLARETKGESRKLEAKMTALMDEFHPAKGMSTDKYIRGIYKMASDGNAKAAGKKEVTDKINKNAKDLPGRLNAGGGSHAGGGKGETPIIPKGIKNVVKQALESMEKGT